uniref:Macaca fascicularis brain cDNA clone: QtrA-17369, similar to human G protein-coupled receptor 12 (GPR12), mRNA, RefSeq: NM_005288.1 n=1 Tax=Macaca fascicularis TaxID=9541 RepID=I7GHX2_MACFA|nr:unnamed protein product [Macaca fascicularis]
MPLLRRTSRLLSPPTIPSSTLSYMLSETKRSRKRSVLFAAAASRPVSPRERARPVMCSTLALRRTLHLPSTSTAWPRFEMLALNSLHRIPSQATGALSIRGAMTSFR